ncbi:low molecular weight phosphatase family protein [Galbibacter pacificus]|uniref:protein-tyrosine-phosphatase n=1 Tax=Galbibacter pacificus TaxID=2996052 RepID=A0ABT6FTX1_9FLAO|nr:low molecular weight phosphatase family protein [Galbibacter pacificus]MDG3583229.1 low molecular weight phosphatase family protein [Galbibacter pacificus]MDG3586710.1 low molecular weight phosphatase family protein [Galbibacter pacificus]
MELRILFICTGNYYRSRFAEILFNELCQEEGIRFRAFSKGLRLSSNNKGPISIHTKNYMEKLRIDISNQLRMPIPVTAEDFDYYHTVIAMDENEHRDLMKETFPEMENKISYWLFADDYIEAPEKVLPLLEKKTREFVEQLKEELHTKK